jgi:hypothetical protein
MYHPLLGDNNYTNLYRYIHEKKLIKTTSLLRVTPKN